MGFDVSKVHATPSQLSLPCSCVLECKVSARTPAPCLPASWHAPHHQEYGLKLSETVSSISCLDRGVSSKQFRSSNTAVPQNTKVSDSMDIGSGKPEVEPRRPVRSKANSLEGSRILQQLLPPTSAGTSQALPPPVLNLLLQHKACAHSTSCLNLWASSLSDNHLCDTYEQDPSACSQR